MTAAMPSSELEDETYENAIISLLRAECALAIRSDKPFDYVLAQTLGRCGMYLNTLMKYEEVFHIFIDEQKNEIHLLQITDLKKINTHVKYHGSEQLRALYASLIQNSDFTVANTDATRSLSSALDLPMYTKIASGLALPFTYRDPSFGVFLFVNYKAEWIPLISNDSPKLRAWADFIYDELSTLFRERLGVREQIFLPNYRKPRWEPVAIMFSDIRNFTTLTSIIRRIFGNIEHPETNILREMLNGYCNTMADIIKKWGGRVDKFMGDGIMAIFGEYENSPSEVVCNSLMAASEMIEEFENIKTDLLKRAFIGRYEVEYNESRPDIDLGIGVNFGTVCFEYFGHDDNLAYTAVGDHVNFAQRLEGMAGKTTDDGRKIFPILISATAERCCRAWLYKDRVQELSIPLKGKDGTYSVWGLSTESFNRDLFRRCVQKEVTWEKAWAQISTEPPPST